MDDELTGWEEHLRDEAWECGELAARRREAEDEARLEAAMAEQEEAEALRARGFPCSSAPCCARGRALAECREDDLPF
jgi:DNA-binding FadR family transcriptional regulator